MLVVSNEIWFTGFCDASDGDERLQRHIAKQSRARREQAKPYCNQRAEPPLSPRDFHFV
jgi:hypothetical protein